MDAIAQQTFEAFAMIYAGLFDRSLVARADYDALLRAARDVYRENMMLRTRLRELERVASSWTGTPEGCPAIVRAREALRDQR